jgi:hypothetical protein
MSFRSVTQFGKALLMTVTLAAVSAAAALAQGSVVSATLTPTPQAYDGPCPVVIRFKGRIEVNGPATVQYSFIRSDGAIPPVETLVFSEAGAKEVETTWTLGGAALPRFGGWIAIETRTPNKFSSPRAGFKLQCIDAGKQPAGPSQKQPAGPMSAGPNLVTKFLSPREASAGEAIGDAVKVQAANIGGGVAGGTLGSGGSAGGYMIDLVLSRAPVTSTAYATFSPNYSDGVLLRGGRVSRTEDLGATADRTYADEIRGLLLIPADTPTGSYYLCAVIDPGNRIAESNEADNISCNRIKIKGAKPADQQQTPQ